MKKQENKYVITLNLVTAFKTTDGQLYENDTDALKHQMDLNFEIDINELIEKFALEIPFFDDSKVCKEFIMANKISLKKIFDRL